MKLVHRLSLIGKTSSSQFLNAKNKYHNWHANSNLIPLAMADTQRKSESQEVQLSISGIVKGYHHCHLKRILASFLLLARRGENVETYVGQIIRIIRSPSLKSQYLVFEWQLDTKAKEKIAMVLKWEKIRNQLIPIDIS